MLQHLLRLYQVAIEMVGYRKSNPILAEIGTKPEKGVTRLNQTIILSELGLQVGSVTQDIEVFLSAGNAVSTERNS